MGASNSSQPRPQDTATSQSANLDKTSKARKREFSKINDDDEKERLEEENLHTPKRKKLKTTSRYIYETLFINGENSDITISAMGKEWKLHKVYLCQCNYFSSMFCGSWRESSLTFIHMDIPDDNIDVDSLKVAFGSLYKDDVMISPARVAQVLAAATLLGLEGLIQQCVVVMREATSSLTVCSFHQAALMYGQQEVVDVTRKWLEQNLMSSASVQLLSDIDIDLMSHLVASPDLYVMQVEMDIYTLLKKWLYLKLHPQWDGSLTDITSLLEVFLKERNLQDELEFLESSAGQAYIPVFSALRLQHVINDLPSAKILEEDKIIPQRWLMPVYRQQWLQMVKVEQGHDKGPSEIEGLQFEKLSMRCGRVLCKEGEYCWRWTGYSFGLDILVSVTSRLVIFKRNTHSQVCPGGVCLHNNRSLVFKLSVASLDSLGNTRYHKTTGVKKLSLNRDEEVVILDIDRTVPFPLHITCQFMLFTPRKNYDHMIQVRGPKKSFATATENNLNTSLLSQSNQKLISATSTKESLSVYENEEDSDTSEK